jgi:hypothetical protein
MYGNYRKKNPPSRSSSMRTGGLQRNWHALWKRCRLVTSRVRSIIVISAILGGCQGISISLFSLCTVICQYPWSIGSRTSLSYQNLQMLRSLPQNWVVFTYKPGTPPMYFNHLSNTYNIWYDSMLSK